MKFKKEFFLVFFILSFIIILELITNIITKKSVDMIYQNINDINFMLTETNIKNEKNILDRNDYENILEKIKKAKRKWLVEENKLSLFIEHDELEKVTKCIVILEENVKNGEYANALENGQELIYWLFHFKEKNSMKLKNIF